MFGGCWGWLGSVVGFEEIELSSFSSFFLKLQGTSILGLQVPAISLKNGGCRTLAEEQLRKN
jgi:hypothetical protein